MHFSLIALTLAAALPLSSAQPVTGSTRAANLPGLSDTQSSHAQKIIDQAADDKVGAHGCTAGIATAIVESNILVYANRAVPKSLDYSYDKIGSDHDSVGIFQQRARFYPDIAASMDPAGSASQFYAEMQNVSGWKDMAVGDLCQEVQGSAYPGRYAEQVDKAKKICEAGGI